MTDTIAQTIGDYQLDAALGRGATGQLLRARHIRLQRTAAVKLFDPRLTNAAGFRSRFADTMRKVAVLQHPHIVTIYDLGEHNGRFYVTMELLDGSLRELLKTAPHGLPLAQVLEFTRQVVEALTYVHAQYIVHGAIKPENLLLHYDHSEGNGRESTIKISDFCVAQWLPDEALSAPAYVSPEQCRGMPIDLRSDVYALGVVLYELVAGTPPFAVRDLAEATQQHLHAQPISPRMLRPEIPTALEAIIVRCLEKRPEDRYRDANELMLALRPLLGAPSSNARPQLLGGHVRVEIEQEQVALAPGTQTMIAVRLVNTGGVSDAFILSVEGAPSGWVSFDITPIAIEAGEEATAALLVVPPRAPESIVGNYDVVVRAQSLAHTTVSGAARMRWRILPYAAASMSVAPSQAEGQNEATYNVQIRNDGNVGTLFLLSAHDDHDALKYALVQTQVYLAPNQKVAVPLHVTAPKRWVGVSKRHTFTVRAKTPTYSQHTTATFTHRAGVHSGILAALSGAVLLLVLIIGLMGNSEGTVAETPISTAVPTVISLPSAPNIAHFSVEPSQVAPAESVLLSWDVKGADRVQINQFGDVPAQGQREFQPDETTNFRLVAWAGEQETVRIERVVVTAPVAAPPDRAPERPQLPRPELPNLLGGRNLLLWARLAEWNTETGPLRFGRPWFGVETGGWAGRARNIVLEDGLQHDWALSLFPLAQPNGERFIEGQFPIGEIQSGQSFVSTIGFAANAQAGAMHIQVRLNDQVIFDGWHAPSGALQPLAVDLAPWVGQSGSLRLRVSAESGTTASGVYWVNPLVTQPR